MEKTKFLEQSPNNQSSKRLIAFIYAMYAIVISTYVFIMTGEYLALIAVWGTITGTVLILIGLGKYQENQQKEIEK